MARTDSNAIRRSAAVFIVGAAATAISGVLVQLVVQPSTTVSDDKWIYPWSSGPFVFVSIVYALLHVLVGIGLVGFGRSGAVGTSRSGRTGVGLAVAGTALLFVGELASLPIRHADVNDGSAGLVGAVFGLGTVLSAVGFLLAGKATASASVWSDWRRFTPLVTGIWTTALVGLAMTKALPSGVAIYGVCLLAMAIALYTDPTPGASAEVDDLRLGRA